MWARGGNCQLAADQNAADGGEIRRRQRHCAHTPGASDSRCARSQSSTTISPGDTLMPRCRNPGPSRGKKYDRGSVHIPRTFGNSRQTFVDVLHPQLLQIGPQRLGVEMAFCRRHRPHISGGANRLLVRFGVVKSEDAARRHICASARSFVRPRHDFPEPAKPCP